MRQTSTKAAINMIKLHRAQTQVIRKSDLTDSEKILVLTQLNLSCEMLLEREGCYYGYNMPDLTNEQRKLIELGMFSKVSSQVEWFMHHYQARVKVKAI